MGEKVSSREGTKQEIVWQSVGGGEVFIGGIENQSARRNMRGERGKSRDFLSLH